MRLALVVLALSLAFCGTASAAPTLFSVGQQDRHLTASFGAPGAEDVTVYVATSPDRATDGRFLEENIDYSGTDFLTAAEIASGQWSNPDQIGPGTYWVMLHASYPCGEASCPPSEYSAVLSLTVPKPRQRYRAKFERGFIATFRLTVSALNGSLPYKLCWRKAGKRRDTCERSSITGSGWDPASDDIFLTRDDARPGKRKRMTFRWYVKGKRVASKRIRISQPD